MPGHRGQSERESLGQLVWRRAHWRCWSRKAQVQDGKGFQSWFGMGRECSRQVLKLYTSLSMDRIRPLFSNLVFLPMEAL